MRGTARSRTGAIAAIWVGNEVGGKFFTAGGCFMLRIPLKRYRGSRGLGIALLPLALVAVMAAGAWRLSKGAPPAAALREYSLRHAGAADIAPQVQAMIADAAGGGEVIVDRTQNRLLVRCSDDTHRLAAQLVGTLDRPSPAVQLAASEPAFAEGYPVAKDRLESAAASLRAQFAADARVRIAVDERTSQLLVVAPESVQRSVAQWLAANTAAANGSADRPAAAEAGPVARAGALAYSLQFISWRELEDALLRLLGQNVPASISRNGELATVRLPGRPELEAVMQIDRRLNQVALQGPDDVTRVWLSVVKALDRRPSGPNLQTQLVRLQRADAQLVRRAVGLIGAVVQGEDEGTATAAVRVGSPAAENDQSENFVAKIFQPGRSRGRSGRRTPLRPPRRPPRRARLARRANPRGFSAMCKFSSCLSWGSSSFAVVPMTCGECKISLRRSSGRAPSLVLKSSSIPCCT